LATHDESEARVVVRRPAARLVDHPTPAPGSDVNRSPLTEDGRVALAAALRRAVRGDVDFAAGTRAAYAGDSSNYRQVPLGVVFPRDGADVAAALAACAAFDAPVLARGAGTSLAGQACNVAVVIDTSRHMTRIVEIDPVARTARVEPGVVLDDLRRAAERHGLTFGPDPATHAWCTVGGMVGNNSCGTHGLYAGKTVDNVERLRVVTYAGDEVDLGSYDGAELARVIAAGGAEGRVVEALAGIGRRHADLVAERFPPIARRVSGYNLDEIVPGRPLHAARLLVGTESTCAIVTEATVRLVTSPVHRRLVVLGYPDVVAAADAVSGLLAHPLLALEGFDGTLVDQMRSHGLNVEHLALLPPGRGWLVAELGADDPATADRRASAFVAALPAGVAHRRYDDRDDQARVWLVRESGLGATAIRTDGGHNAEGWEDAAVDPVHLGTYLRRLTALWDEYGYRGAWYGHFGQGCVHTRNDFDLGSAAGLAAYRSYVERAADLVVELGGSLSGEHGDGQSRGELLERMYGPELVDAFREVKAVFDPRGRMNPGKLVDAFPLDTNLRHGPGHRTSALRPTFFTLAADGGSLQQAAERCVGVGRCRRDDAGTMCPSYRATRDEVHSTRGRAKVLAEMFQGEVTPETWRNEDAHDALDLCLACKGCAVDCPTHVDMATYKAEFLAHHYRRRLRPVALYALGLVPWVARAATRVPRLANAVLGAPRLGVWARRAAGVTTDRPPPRFAAVSWRRGRAARGADVPSGATVVVWPDTFTDAFRPGGGEDLVAVLEALGERVAVPRRWACCARPLYDAGMLDLARRTLTGLLDVLDPWIARGIPVVVAEPSCLAAFRDELPGLFGADPRAAALAGLARSPAEHLLVTGALDALAELVPPGRRPGSVVHGGATGAPAGRVVVHPHCHGRAVGTPAADRRVLEALGYVVDVLDAGCCGLAGSFGFRAEHEPLSRTIGEDQWLPQVRLGLAAAGAASTAASGDAELVVDGFSCATQLEHLDGPPSTTLVALVRRHLAGTPRPG
jgi:FAD/FMN-containing dehydrogenase/Fe-S oxidoreductase